MTLQASPNGAVVEHKNLAEALVAFQAEAPKLVKHAEANAGAFKYMYLDLADAIETIQPVLAKHGLAFSTYPCFGPNNEPALRYKLTHSSGDCESEVMPLMIQKADPQGQGSAITYARRYAMTAVLNLSADKDDDGAAATQPNRAPKPAAQPAPQRVTREDILELMAASKGLNANQIKQAFVECNIPIPDPLVWNAVPKDKAVLMCEALAGMERGNAVPDIVAPEVG